MLPHTIVNSHFSHKNIFGKQYQHGKIQIYRFDWPFSRWIQKRSKPKVSTKRSRFKNLKKNRRSDNFWMLPCRNYSEATYDLSLEDFSIETELIIFTLSLIRYIFFLHSFIWVAKRTNSEGKLKLFDFRLVNLYVVRNVRNAAERKFLVML